MEALRRYFTVADYCESPKEKHKSDPLWKVCELLDELNKQAKDMWVPGKWVAINKQTLGFQFQGALGMKLRISYKREGDGFQCNTVCDGGYTYSFYFCHGPPSNVLIFHQQLDESCGLHLGCPIDGLGSTWTTSSTRKSYSRHCTLQKR